MSDYEIQVTLLGPERTVKTSYGERQERDTLARLQVPVEGDRGWTLYQEAVRRAVVPPVLIVGPERMTQEQAEEFRDQWTETHGR